MEHELDYSSHPPMIRLLGVAFDTVAEELQRKLQETEFNDVRPGHGCVFGGIDVNNGSRLTELAERALMTKQTVGEVVSDLEARGYVERVPDPGDGRAKIIRLTERGHEAYATGRRLIDEIEQEWTERYGEEPVAKLRGLLEAVVAERFGALA